MDSEEETTNNSGYIGKCGKKKINDCFVNHGDGLTHMFNISNSNVKIYVESSQNPALRRGGVFQRQTNK